MLQVYNQFKEFWADLLALLTVYSSNRNVVRRTYLWTRKRGLRETIASSLLLLWAVNIILTLFVAQTALKSSGMDRARAVEEYAAIASALKGYPSFSREQRERAEAIMASHPGFPFSLAPRERLIANALQTAVGAITILATIILSKLIFPKFRREKKLHQSLSYNLSVTPGIALPLAVICWAQAYLPNTGRPTLIVALALLGVTLSYAVFISASHVRIFRLSALKYIVYLLTLIALQVGVYMAGVTEFALYVPLAKDIDSLLKLTGS